jgi:mono/diheme cytochrome c family protein
MKRFLKWLGIILSALLALIVVAGIGVYVVSGSRLNRQYNIAVKMIPIPTDVEAVARGEHIAQSRSCMDCHGPDLSGDVLLDDPLVGTVHTANLTPGQGGIGADYTDEDYLRALRHGVGRDGKGLWIMPSHEYYYLSDGDTADLIAYLKTLPAVDKQPGENRAGPLARLLFLTGSLPLLPAESIDHTGPRPTAPELGVTVEYGAYLTVGCAGCHGQNFAGGPMPGAPPGTIAANLTPAGNLSGWTEEVFRQFLRTGVTPAGREVDRSWMPIDSTKHLTDEEISAIWLFLQSLPPQE